MMIITHILAGEPIHVVLFLAYSVTVVIVIERLWHAIRSRGSLSPYLSPAYPTQPNNPYYRLTTALSEQSTEPARSEWARFHIATIVGEYDRGLWILSSIGTLAPMLGLLGTVTGLMTCFHDLQSTQLGMTALSTGIWEAMSTTVFGLIVGIIAIFMHRVLDRRVHHIATQLDVLLSYLNAT